MAAAATYTATIIGGASGVKDLAGNALASNYSWSFATASGGGGSTFTVFQVTDSPAELTNNDGQGIVLGMKFRSSQNGFITGVRYYKGAGTTGTHTVICGVALAHFSDQQLSLGKLLPAGSKHYSQARLLLTPTLLMLFRCLARPATMQPIILTSRRR